MGGMNSVDADARIFYVYMDDLKHCTSPDPEPSWPDVARGTSIVVSTRAPSTCAPTDTVWSQQTSGSAHQTGSVSTMEYDVRASNTIMTKVRIFNWTQTQHPHLYGIPGCDGIYMMQSDAKCILSKKSDCCIDVKGFRFFTMERLFYALQLWVIRNTLDSLLNC